MKMFVFPGILLAGLTMVASATPGVTSRSDSGSTVTLEPGECHPRDPELRPRVCNTGETPITVRLDSRGRITNIDLGGPIGPRNPGVTVTGDNLSITITGSGNVNIQVIGNNNQITTRLGGTPGGTVTVTGNGNTVRNQRNDSSDTTFTSNGSNNTLYFGGEAGNHATGTWATVHS